MDIAVAAVVTLTFFFSSIFRSRTEGVTLFKTNPFARIQINFVYSLIAANSRHIFPGIPKFLFVRLKNFFKIRTSKNF